MSNGDRIFAALEMDSLLMVLSDVPDPCSIFQFC
jgi:hypothetical protein